VPRHVLAVDSGAWGLGVLACESCHSLRHSSRPHPPQIHSSAPDGAERSEATSSELLYLTMEGPGAATTVLRPPGCRERHTSGARRAALGTFTCC